MECKIFYSWQSDVGNSRNFMSECIKKLNIKLPEIASVEITRDTEGIPGSPDIGNTIFEKIDNCDIFIADVTIINAKTDVGRLTPNPNVMLELGYAIKALGWDRIILLYNKDESDVEKLPFDINHQRMTGFSISGEKSEYKKKVVDNVALTIDLLKNKGLLHGGEPELLKIRKDIANVFYKGIEIVLKEFIKNKKQDPSDPEDRTDYSKFLVISNDMVNASDKLDKYLSFDELSAIKSVLVDLNNVRDPESEMGSVYYMENILKEVVDEFYIYFCDQLPILELKEVMYPEFIDVIYKLDNTYLSDIKENEGTDDNALFSHVNDKVFIKKTCGDILCDGVYNDDGFTGYVDSERYCGNCKHSKRSGKGYLKCISFHKDEWELEDKEIEGLWEENKLVEGVIHSAIIKQNNNEYEICANSSGDIMYPGNISYMILRIEDIVNCYEDMEHYYFGDVLIKDGKEIIKKESLRPFTNYCMTTVGSGTWSIL